MGPMDGMSKPFYSLSNLLHYRRLGGVELGARLGTPSINVHISVLRFLRESLSHL